MSRLIKKKPRGLHYLSIIFGVIFATIYIVFVIIVNEGFSQMQDERWVIFIAGIFLTFIAGWGFVQGVAYKLNLKYFKRNP